MVEAPGSARRSPFGSRLLGPREQDPRKLRQRVRLLLTALLLMTNLAGAVVTLVINLWAVPALEAIGVHTRAVPLWMRDVPTTAKMAASALEVALA